MTDVRAIDGVAIDGVAVDGAPIVDNQADNTGADNAAAVRVSADVPSVELSGGDSASDAPPTPGQLEDEGDIAADYIEELLDITDLDGDIEMAVRGGRAYLSVTSSEVANLRLLSRPDTVNALQELTRIAVQAKTGAFSRLILDIGGSREAREAELTMLVEKAAERLDAGSESAALPPMSSYERKLVHDVVAGLGLSSESHGEGRDRHTVIRRS